MRIHNIEVRGGAENRVEWDPKKKILRVVAVGLGPELIREVVDCVLDAAGEDTQLFIPLKEASQRLDICIPKLQEFSRSHYKGFPAVLDGNKYKVNARMLPDWADRYTADAIEGRP